MRLLNAHTLQLEDFFEAESLPSYYILSHRWGRGEISYKDFQKGRKKESEGYKKIADFCTVIIKRHASRKSSAPCYVWVDTCCIDKRSSSELSQAINSMYQWYMNAAECIVLLSDVFPGSKKKSKSKIRQSVWFSRGWTLQELLAPSVVTFVNQQWQVLGHKCSGSCTCSTIEHGLTLFGPSLNGTLEEATGIQTAYLADPCKIRTASIARRMSWAAKRHTTRVEDNAYCLLGLFDVNMPLLYGEGRKAFRRLQEEIIKTSTDHSIFAWPSSSPASDTFIPGIFARDASDFLPCNDLEAIHPISSVTWPYALTNFALELRASMQLVRLPQPNFEGIVEGYLIRLNCTSRQVPVWLLLVERRDHYDPQAPRYFTKSAVLVGHNSLTTHVQRIEGAEASVETLFVQPYDSLAVSLPTATNDSQGALSKLEIGVDYGTTLTGVVTPWSQMSARNSEKIQIVDFYPRLQNREKIQSVISYTPNAQGEAQWGSDLHSEAALVHRTKLELDLWGV